MLDLPFWDDNVIFVCASWEAKGWSRKGHSIALHVVWGYLMLVRCLRHLISTEDSAYLPHTCCPQSRTRSVPLPPWNVKQTNKNQGNHRSASYSWVLQSECLQMTSQFLLPCSKIKDISAKEEAGMPAGALRGKKWWSSNSVIILGSQALLSFYLKTSSVCCFPKRSRLLNSFAICTWRRPGLPLLYLDKEEQQWVIQSQGK